MGLPCGTIIKMLSGPYEGEEGTVVYFGLDGYGVKWGRHTVTLKDLTGTDAESFAAESMLRKPIPTMPNNWLDCMGIPDDDLAGEDYMVTWRPDDQEGAQT